MGVFEKVLAMNSHSKQQNLLLSSILLLLAVSFAFIFLTSCDLSFKIPSFPIWKRDPTKQDVLDAFALKLNALSGAEVRLDGDDITFSFTTGTTESILAQQVKRVFTQLSSIADKDSLQIRIASGSAVYTPDEAAAQVRTHVNALLASKEVWKEEVAYKAHLSYQGFDFELQGDLVFYDLHRILMTDDEWAQLQADTFKSLYRDVLNLNEATVGFEHISAIFTALSAIKASSPDVQGTLSGQRDHLDALVGAVYASATEEQKKTIDQLRDMVGVFVVPLTMVDNTVTRWELTSIPLMLDGIDVSDQYTFEFREKMGDGDTITALDLSQGASTFIIFLEATPREGSPLAPICGDVVIKIGSVSIGDGSELYTIEDALERAGHDTLFVRYNTSFASQEVAERVYGRSTHRIGSPTTVVLPYDGTLSSGIDDVFKTLDEDNKEKETTGGPITRSSEYVRLTVPDGITVNVKGHLVVNAKRAANETKFQGHVTGPNYSVLHLAENSKVTIEYRGELYALGFVEGDGEIEVESGGYVYEGLFISSFRGGTATWKISDEVFPFDQFTVAQIEPKVVIKAGGNYIAKSLIWAGGRYTSGDFVLVGDDAIIRMTSGSVTKSFDASSCRVTITLDGMGSINDGGIKVGNLTATTEGKAIPFDGTWHFIVSADSSLDINAKVALLPGSSLTVESGATVVVKEGTSGDKGRNELTIFNAGNIPYPEDYNKYPNDTVEHYYRYQPNLGYSSSTAAEVHNAGTIEIEKNSGIAGAITNDGGTIKDDGAIKEYTYYVVSGSAGDAEVYTIVVQ